MNSSNKPFISVVVVSFNTGEVLFQCIESALKQRDVEVEVVIVNNGNNLDIVKRLGDFDSQNSNVSVVTGQGNVGFATACNLGAAKSRSDCMVFLNPDCVMFPDCLYQMVHESSKTIEDCIVGGNLQLPSGVPCGNDSRDFPTPWRLVVESLSLHRIAPRHPYFRRVKQDVVDFDGDRQTQVVSGALFMIPRRAYLDLGGFDQEYFLHVEDIDLCLRWHQIRGKITKCHDARAVHFQSSSDVSWFFIEYHKARGFCLYFKKHFSSYYPVGFILMVKFLIFGRLLVRYILKVTTLGLFPTYRRGATTSIG